MQDKNFGQTFFFHLVVSKFILPVALQSHLSGIISYYYKMYKRCPLLFPPLLTLLVFVYCEDLSIALVSPFSFQTFGLVGYTAVTKEMIDDCSLFRCTGVMIQI